ncbi:MAG TPA: DUF2512 family protein [Bacilli bacterium]
MNRSFVAILIKLVLTFLAAWLAFDVLIDNPFVSIVIFSVVATVINYLIGDMILLRRFGNIIASIADGIIAAIIAYIFDLLSDDFTITFASALVFGILIAICEYVFHKYLVSNEDPEASD